MVEIPAINLKKNGEKKAHLDPNCTYKQLLLPCNHRDRPGSSGRLKLVAPQSQIDFDAQVRPLPGKQPPNKGLEPQERRGRGQAIYPAEGV